MKRRIVLFGLVFISTALILEVGGIRELLTQGARLLAGGNCALIVSIRLLGVGLIAISQMKLWSLVLKRLGK